MASGIYVALSGAVAQSNAFDVAANNIANAGTVGFRSEKIRFDEALTKAQGKDSAFAVVGKTQVDPEPGALQQTGNPLDLALRGDGYFVVKTPRGERLTRAGNFQLDPAGRLTTADGSPVATVEGPPIVAPQGTTLSVDRTGIVRAFDQDDEPGDTGQTLGTLRIVQVPVDQLVREGANVFAAQDPAVLQRAEAAQGQDGAGSPEVISGAIETANYNVARGMVDLIHTSRTFDTLTQMIKSYQQIDESAARGLR